MRLYIIRHADPDYANDTITDLGKQEAAALAERMAKQGLDRIYCSPLGRAQVTMSYTADRLGMGYEILDWTAELSWRIEREGFTKSMAWDVHGEIIRGGEFPSQENWFDSQPYDDAQYHEGFEQLKRKSDAFLGRLGYVREGGLYRIEKENREKVAVFCHGGFGLTWLAHLLEIPLPMMYAGFTLATTSVTTILFDERSEKWATPRCTGMADVSHLYAAGIEGSRSGIKANWE